MDISSNQPARQDTLTCTAVTSPSNAQVPQLTPNGIRTADSNSTLFALIVGINEYASDDIPNLQGAVPDADDMELFLTETLRVPKSNIISLRDKAATRDAMENSIRALSLDARVKKGDPILIYYAGHGTESNAPKGWPSGKVRMLVPHDFDPSRTGDKKTGLGLLDITFSRLLNTLARAKGDNITVICDSCHSGSGSDRPLNQPDVNHPDYASREIKLHDTYTVPEDVLDDEAPKTSPSGSVLQSIGELSNLLNSFPKQVGVGGALPTSSKKDEDMLPAIPFKRTMSSRGVSAISVVSSGFETAGQTSHTFLAACKLGQTAKESFGRGAFSKALLDLWRKDGVETLTYKEVIDRLPDLFSQNPQCEGINQSRIIFNSKVSTPSRLMFELNLQKSGEYVLSAGQAHGIIAGAQFSVFTDRDMRTRLGTVIARQPSAFETLVDIAPNYSTEFMGTAYALQTNTGGVLGLKLLIESTERFQDLLHKLADQLTGDQAERPSITLVVDRGAQPDLILGVSANDMHVAKFELTDPICRKFGLHQLAVQFKVEANSLYPILRSAADFYSNLRRNSSEHIISSKVKLSCYRLARSTNFQGDFAGVMMPDSDNLNQDGTIFIDVDEQANYGFCITNKSRVDISVSLFYFGMSDLSVQPYYQPVTSKDGRADASLPAEGTLTIGYGPTGTQPHSYTLPPGQDVDVGFLKLFLSTELVDFSGMEQKGPLVRMSSPVTAPVRRAKKKTWDTITVAIVQQKKAITA